jgi:hypothetical protein
MTYVVALNSFVTGRRTFYAGDRYVPLRAAAEPFSDPNDARDVARAEQARIGRGALLSVERSDGDIISLRA